MRHKSTIKRAFRRNLWACMWPNKRYFASIGLEAWFAEHDKIKLFQRSSCLHHVTMRGEAKAMKALRCYR